MMATVGALAAGGIAGTLCRAGAAALLSRPGAALPWGRLAVNLTGCFLIGLFDSLAERSGFGVTHARFLLMTGFCGAYTTFSALIFELDALVRVSPTRAAVYLLLSVVAGLAMFRAGTALGAA